MEKTYATLMDDYYWYSIAKCNSHYDMSEKYRKKHRIFGAAVVITTSLVGTSVFSTLTGSTNLVIQIITAVLSVLAIVLAALQTFLGFSELQSQHKSAGVGFGQIRRNLEVLAVKFPSPNGGADSPEMKELELITKHFDDLDSASPTIPDEIWDKNWAEIREKKGTERELELESAEM